MNLFNFNLKVSKTSFFGLFVFYDADGCNFAKNFVTLAEMIKGVSVMNRKRQWLKHKWQFLIGILLLTLGLLSLASTANAKINSNLTDVTGGCQDLYLVFARGSGEALSGPSEQAWREALTKVLRPRAINYEFYELGSQKWGGFQYPAVAVSDSLEGYINMAGAVIGAGESYEFGRSVVAGSGELAGYINAKSQACPNAKFILGGYSQGAMAIMPVVGRLPADKILYVATFGDPKLYLPEGEPKASLLYDGFPDACYGRNLSNYRIYAPNCFDYEGILGSNRPYQTQEYIDKIGIWCHNSDIMCSSGSSMDDHVAYAGQGLYQHAATKIGEVLRREYPDQVHTTGIENYQNAEVLLVLDQMADSAERFEARKAQAKALAEKVLAGGGEVATLLYSESASGYAGATMVLENAETNTQLLRIENTRPVLRTENDEFQPGHSLLHFINRTIPKLGWRNGATKSMVIFTDTQCASPSRLGTTAEDVIELSLSIDPINIYVNSSPEVIASYQELITGTSGKGFELGADISLSEEKILERPEAVLGTQSYTGLIDEEFYFDGSLSTDANGEKRTLRYDWDLDFDGEFELIDAGSVVTKKYQTAKSGYMQMRVTDQYGNVSTMSARVDVVAQGSKISEVTSLTATPHSKTSARISFATTGEKALLILNDLPIGFLPPKGDFILDQLSGSATVRIAPYDIAGRRGQAQTITALPLLPGAPDAGVAIRDISWREIGTIKTKIRKEY